MDRFQEMQVFVSVVDAASFVRAAESLDMSKAAVSRYISDLESRLGVRLLHRTTRRLSLTGEGSLFYERCKSLLQELDEAERELSCSAAEVGGVLRINAPVSFGVLYLASAWAGFRKLYPNVQLDITHSDRVVDLVEEGYDLAIRIGQLTSSSLISRRLGTTSLVLCASPEYLQKSPTVTCPDDLLNHSLLSYSYASGGNEWHFTGPDSESQTIRFQPAVRSNTGDVCATLALEGQGITLQPQFIVSEHLRSGRLVPMLPEYTARESGVYVVYPTRQFLAPKVRVLIDFLVEWFETPRW
ncbi:LysR family transcriptional regulator [Parathalassolituus penaei]|uniref:LysR family transcriptional regulator n=1 Tax=Parathalassolituus penaei TaxID=2997323 RepID=A0A9X3EBH3_9GAMM|nr:LysR family transcriptional regulator [Parathalassolituus penaei]MCY0964547.1 LysR family transcriptional regulator [Parathalassolituus penaei]